MVAFMGAALPSVDQCFPQPQNRRLILADTLTAARAAPGLNVNVDLRSVPAQDSLGRIAHVRGIQITGQAGLNVPGATNAVVTAYQLRGVIRNIFLEDVTGHSYLMGADLRDLIDDSWFRHLARVGFSVMQAGDQVAAGVNANGTIQPDVTNDYGLGLNVGISTPSRSISTYIPFTTHNPGADPTHGLIPLAALQAASNPLRFTFAPSNGIPGNPAGVSLTGFTNTLGQTGLDIWLDVVYLDRLVVSAPWIVESYTMPQSSGVLRRSNMATEYAWVRFKPEDAFGGTVTPDGRAQASDLDQYSIQVAGFTEIPGYAKQYMGFRQLELAAMEPMSALARMNAAQDLPMVDNTTSNFLAMCLLPYRPKGSGEAAGEITFRYGTLGALTNVRYLQRSVACVTGDRFSGFLGATGAALDLSEPVMTTDRGTVLAKVQNPQKPGK